MDPKADGSLGGVEKASPGQVHISAPAPPPTSKHSGSVEKLPKGNEVPFDLLRGDPARTVLLVINRNENLTH